MKTSMSTFTTPKIKTAIVFFLVVMTWVSAAAQRSRGKEKIGQDGQVVGGQHKLRCKEPEKTYARNVQAKVKGAIKGLSNVDAANLEASLKTEVEKLTTYSQEGVDLDLILFRLCELTINRNISDEESARLFSEATKNWNRKLPLREQKNIINQLNTELEANLRSANELKKNTETFLNALNNVAGKGVLRNPGIKILNTFFPMENIVDTAESVNDLLNASINSYLGQKLDTNRLEQQKFADVARLIAMTVEKTSPTINSLTDKEGTRYPIYDDIWKENVKNLRQIDVFDVTKFQQTYTDLNSLRSNYNIVSERILDYLTDLDNFFSPTDRKITRESIYRILTSERLCFSLVTTYSESLATNIKSLSDLQKVVKESLQ